MNNKKEIERIADILCEFDDEEYYAMAKCLVNAGYGNVKQAVKEFAEKLKEEFWKIDGDWQGVDGEELCEQIDNLITELYGVDDE